MSRRPAAGVADRHALLAGGAYPSSSSPTPSQLNRNGTLTPGGAGGAHLQPRTASPFEQPYSHYSTGTPYPPSSSYNTSDPYSEYDRGAPKKEGQPGGGGGAFGSFLSSIGARTAEDLEEQNDERLEGLSTKVKMLKDVSLNAAAPECTGRQRRGELGTWLTVRGILKTDYAGDRQRSPRLHQGP